MDLSFFEIINALVIIIGVPTVVGVLIKIGRKMEVLDTLKKTTDRIKDNLKIVTDWLTDNTEFDQKELNTYSQLNLTETGRKLIAENSFEEVFKNNKPDFFNYIDGEEPKLKYDVEQAAIKSIYLLADKSYMSFIKVFLYNNPKRSIENVAPTYGVFVRDKYLAEHEEITE